MTHHVSICSRILCTALIAGVLVFGALPADAQQADKVLAVVGNEKITENDLNQIADAVPERFRQFYLSPEGRQKTLDYVVNIYVLAKKAEQEGLDKTDRAKHLWRFTKNDLLARLYLEKQSKNIPPPTEADAQAYYDKNRSQYSSPESIHLHHILVKTEKEARDALKQIKKGADFGELATKVSMCPSKHRGGDLSWLPKGSLVTEVESAAFAMNKGEIKGPVKSKFGYHVLKVEDKKKARDRSFDEVKAYITEQLKYQRQQENYDKLAQALRKEMNVKLTAPAPAAPAKAPPAAGPKQ